MGKITGFLEIERHERTYKPAADRVRNFREFVIPLEDHDVKKQAARCMDCGIPYCHEGCPVNNQIPDWNDLVYRDDWEKALHNLHSTNNFPEMTGRICPAPCEAACTLNIIDSPVTIKTIECAIIDKGFEEGWVVAEPPEAKTGKVVSIIGSGPAGLAAAQQLARVGHDVHVYEKHAYPGELLRYGIPDFKMEKYIVERRVRQMEKEGVIFHCNEHVGISQNIEAIVESSDAVLLAVGSEMPRDLPIEGREFRGIHFAMDFLPQQNKRVSGEPIGNVEPISASDKHVIVIGGGDTGSDCIGTSFRQGALSVTQFEILPTPPKHENKALTWPHWPLKLRTSSSQEEGAKRDWSVMTQRFSGKNGHVTAVECVRVDENFDPVPNSEFLLKADLVLLAMGFTNPVHQGMIDQLGLELDDRGNVKANEFNYKTSLDKIYTAGDMRRGQSLVVWAIREGRQAARAIDEFLMGETTLPR